MVDEIVLCATMTKESTGSDSFRPEVMAALAKVPRHEFVPVEYQPYAYVNQPLQIGYDKTVSQPYIVALMTDLLRLTGTDRVLEVGTGLGYQAAVLAEIAGQVYSVEIIEELAEGARKRLTRLGYRNITLRVGDGSTGWGEHAPFDAIIVTAAPNLITAALLTQLKAGGRLVIPAGASPESQSLLLVEKNDQGRIQSRDVLPVRFSELAVDSQVYRT
ncbi:MAG: protein-L-isoaspartate(D-aspartate) O-methyltransferase [Alphaproteobacteria bacterium]|nr:protein-L-isoaspartate(D-aspartate) O-methyltransferase [Alphaproteobacteria bacterium]